MVYGKIETPAPARVMDTQTVSTPYGTVTISEGGRKVTFELYSDVHQSRHNTALFAYLQHLIKLGVTQFNTAHLNLSGRDRSLALKRGKARLDLVYIYEGETYECELKTNREIGLDITAIQLKEFVKYCQHLVLLVPRGSIGEMATILKLINLEPYITIQAYDSFNGED